MRALRIVLGYLWSVVLLLIGVWLWRHHAEIIAGLGGVLGDDPVVLMRLARCASVFAVSGGLFVYMFLVADDLCPNAPMTLSGFLRFFTGTLAMGTLGWSVWLICRVVV